MNCTLLIVDDSPILRAAMRKVARLAGVPEDRITTAGNGQEALDALAKTPVDLVLLDLNMPVMDGEQFVRELRNRPEIAATRIVVVSTEANADRLERLRTLGVLDTLRKPFEPEDLCHLISKLLGASRCGN